jgi:translocation and assembly module TamB
VIPSGGIDLIRGRLDILGRRLDLTEASIRLEGSLDPQLRVVATNSSDGITSSVILDGRVSEPVITFASSPPLPEEEVLAHLLFGRQLNSLSPLQAAQLANAVATLAGRGGDGIIGKLRRNFGLDDFDLISDAKGGTSLRLGRYVSEDIYTEVIVGTEGTSQLNLNLDISPGVTVRGSADSDGDTGIGIFVEKDY